MLSAAGVFATVSLRREVDAYAFAFLFSRNRSVLRFLASFSPGGGTQLSQLSLNSSGSKQMTLFEDFARKQMKNKEIEKQSSLAIAARLTPSHLCKILRRDFKYMRIEPLMNLILVLQMNYKDAVIFLQNAGLAFIPDDPLHLAYQELISIYNKKPEFKYESINANQILDEADAFLISKNFPSLPNTDQ